MSCCITHIRDVVPEQCRFSLLESSTCGVGDISDLQYVRDLRCACFCRDSWTQHWKLCWRMHRGVQCSWSTPPRMAPTAGALSIPPVLHPSNRLAVAFYTKIDHASIRSLNCCRSTVQATFSDCMLFVLHTGLTCGWHQATCPGWMCCLQWGPMCTPSCSATTC